MSVSKAPVFCSLCGPTVLLHSLCCRNYVQDKVFGSFGRFIANHTEDYGGIDQSSHIFKPQFVLPPTSNITRSHNLGGLFSIFFYRGSIPPEPWYCLVTISTAPPKIFSTSRHCLYCTLYLLSTCMCL